MYYWRLHLIYHFLLESTTQKAQACAGDFPTKQYKLIATTKANSKASTQTTKLKFRKLEFYRKVSGQDF